MLTRIDPRIVVQMKVHACEDYPRECCGLVVGTRGAGQRVVRLTNIQDRLHAMDPAAHPRSARTAYALGFEDQRVVEDLHDDPAGTLLAFYHSHPDHAAYFSAEDAAQATPFGEPTYPEALQIVLSVIDRQVREIRAFRWWPVLERYVAWNIPGLS